MIIKTAGFKQYILFASVLFMISVLFFMSGRINVTPSEFICKSSADGSHYCRYKGPIERAYLNKDGLALFFLDAKVKSEELDRRGFVGVKSFDGVALNVNDSEINKSMSKLIEKAFFERKKVELHMREVSSGYLVVDRVWVNR